LPLDAPNLDDRTFDDLYREVVARVPVHTPEWTNVGDSDPGTTLLQLFTFLVDNLGYRSNRIPEAMRRTFLGLLGVGLRPAVPARGLVSMTATAAVTVPRGSIARAGKVPFRTQRTVRVLPVEAHVVWKRPNRDLDAATVQHLIRLHGPVVGSGNVTSMAFYDPTELTAPPPGGALAAVDLSDQQDGPVDGAVWIALTVGDDAVRAAGNDPVRAVTTAAGQIAGATLTIGIHPGGRPSDATSPPQRSGAPSSDPGLLVEAAAPGAAPSYQRLVITHADPVLDRPGVIDVRLPELTELTPPWPTSISGEGVGDLPPLLHDRELAARVVTWLRVRRRADTSGSTAGAAVLSWVGVNTALALQAVAVRDERLGTGTGAPDQVLRVMHTPVLLDTDTADALVDVVGPRGEWERWERRTDLDGCGPDDRAYVVDAESGTVRFGSGVRGARPPAGAAIRISYEYGGGVAGLVPPDAISTFDGTEPVKLRNPLATWGAADTETVAEAERSIPAWLRHRDRAVTAADFREIALRTPGVDLGRVDVLGLFDPRSDSPVADRTDAAGAVTVMVVPRADATAPTPPASTDRHVLTSVCAWLEPRRLLTTQLFVRGPQWVPVVVSVGVALAPGEVREEVETAVRTALLRHLSALDGGLRPTASELAVETTGASPQGWPLGAAVRADDLLAAATRVPGVRFVEGVRLAVVRNGAVSAATAIALSGLELPHAKVFVTTGAPDDPLGLLGSSLAAPAALPIPVIPRKC
jgi:predicted phage baseplate assembly protein